MKYYAVISLEIDAEDEEAAQNTLDLAVRGAYVYGVIDAWPDGDPELSIEHFADVD